MSVGRGKDEYRRFGGDQRNEPDKDERHSQPEGSICCFCRETGGSSGSGCNGNHRVVAGSCEKKEEVWKNVWKMLLNGFGMKSGQH